MPHPPFDPACPVTALPFQVGDKWTALVVLCLENGPMRFTAIRALLPGVTAKVLTETLRAMDRDGFVIRTEHDENPPRVEYALTPLGRTLLDLVEAVRVWSRANLAQVLARRQEAAEVRSWTRQP